MILKYLIKKTLCYLVKSGIHVIRFVNRDKLVIIRVDKINLDNTLEKEV